MTVDEFLQNPDVLGMIYGHMPEMGDALRVRSININWRGPTVILRFDLSGFPESAPEDWEAARFDTVQCHLQFLAVKNLAVEDWNPPSVCRMEVAPERERRLHVRIHGDGMDIRFECSDSVLVGHVSAYKLHVDGSDGGPRSFVSRIDARRHATLPETWEKAYCERV
ncbi:Imm50 family immunity protein [Streptomyces sp. NPDC048297]|uniref:Imm50 family immunity protein n=1 Tax=Streptomyces sp. NPDC048297 TaxID=3365531 RepID=UPI0037135C61